MLFGLVIGFAVGLNVGLWLSAFLIKRLYDDQVEYYKKSSDNWFNEYLKMLDWYNQMTALYYKEALKNITNDK